MRETIRQTPTRELSEPFNLIKTQLENLITKTVSQYSLDGIRLINQDQEVLINRGYIDKSDHQIDIAANGIRATLLVKANVFNTKIEQAITHDWQILIKLATQMNESTTIIDSLLQSNEQLLGMYELVKQSPESLVGEDLGAYYAKKVLKNSGMKAAMIIDADGNKYYEGPEEIKYFLLDYWNRTDVNARVYRAGQTGLLIDILVTKFTQQKPGGLIVVSNDDQRIDTPQQKLLGAIASHLDSMFTVSNLHKAGLKSAIIERDVETAGKLSDHIMPKEQITCESIEVYGRCDFARLASGDFYNYYKTDYGVAAVVGDVSGKGIGASIVMTMVSTATTIAIKTDTSRDPAEILDQINSEVFDYLSEMGMFVTMAIAIWEEDTQQLKIANAGHSPVISMSDRAQAITPHDPPIGVLEKLSGQSETFRMNENDIVMLGSDGLAEQENSEGIQRGYEALEMDLIAARGTPAVELVNTMFKNVADFAQDTPQDDDTTALILRRIPKAAEQNSQEAYTTQMETLEIDADLKKVQKIGPWLTQIDTGDQFSSKDISKFELALAELCNNIIVHGYNNEPGRKIKLDCTVADHHLIVTVCDNCDEFIIPENKTEVPEEPTVHGYGLIIINKVTDEFSVERTENKNVWTLKFSQSEASE